MSGLRLTSEEVDDILLTWDSYPDPVLEMCRDWLDMQARFAALEAVVDAVREALGHWWFINPYQNLECLHCGETHHEEAGFPHAAGCAFVALRDALSAVEDE